MAEIVRSYRGASRSRFRTQSPVRHHLGFAALLGGVFLAAAAVGGAVLPHAATQPASLGTSTSISRTLAMCSAGRGSNCVIDGDTFRLDGQSIRIADIDTPEARNYRCAAEKALADRATARMRQLLNAGPFELAPYERDQDQYGRKLRIIRRDGQSLGQVLVAEGLARSWDGARHPWC